MNIWRRIEPFLYSRKSLAGTVGAIVGIALLAAGVTSGVVGVGVIVGLYVIGYLAVPKERGVATTLRTTTESADIEDGLRKLLISIYGRVADDVYARVGSIGHSIVEILPKTSQGVDTADPNLHLVSRTALDYLPQALNAYLAIPRIYAERRPMPDGRTAHDVLLEQLNVMDAKLNDVRQDIERNDNERLLSNVRFLQERFAGSALEQATVAVGASGESESAKIV